MMIHVNTLTRISGKFISLHCIIASILYSIDKKRRPKLYKEFIFTKDNIVKITSDISHKNLELMLVINSTIK